MKAPQSTPKAIVPSLLTPTYALTYASDRRVQLMRAALASITVGAVALAVTLPMAVILGLALLAAPAAVLAPAPAPAPEPAAAPGRLA